MSDVAKPAPVELPTIERGRLKAGLRVFVASLYVLIAFVHALLPVQAGMPSLGPLHATTIALGIGYFALAFARPKVLLDALKDRYATILLAFGFTAAFLTYAVNGKEGAYDGWEQLPLVTTNAVLGYVLNIATMRLLGTRLVFRILLWFGVTAIVLTMLEGMMSFRLPPYQAIALLQLSRGVDTLTAGRASGPLGNSLITSMQMSLLALIAMAELKGYVRVAVVLLAISAGLLTGSKSTLFVLFVIAAIVVIKTLQDTDVRRAKVKMWFGIVAAVIVTSGAIAAGPNAPVVGTLTNRISGDQKDLSDLGTELRANAIQHLGYDELLGDPAHAFFGSGAGMAGQEMQQMDGNNTVDNVYLALAFDYGLPATFLYLCGVFGPYFASRPRWKGSLYYLAGGVVIAFYGLSFNSHLVTTVAFLTAAFGARVRVESEA